MSRIKSSVRHNVVIKLRDLHVNLYNRAFHCGDENNSDVKNINLHTRIYDQLYVIFSHLCESIEICMLISLHYNYSCFVEGSILSVDQFLQ